MIFLEGQRLLVCCMGHTYGWLGPVLAMAVVAGLADGPCVRMVAAAEPESIDQRAAQTYEGELRQVLHTQNRLVETLDRLLSEDKELRARITSSITAAQRQLREAEYMAVLRRVREPAGEGEDDEPRERIIDLSNTQAAMRANAQKLMAMLPTLKANLGRNRQQFEKTTQDSETNRQRLRGLADPWGRRSVEEARRALAVTEDALLVNPQDDGARTIRAAALLRLGRLTQADEEFTLLVKHKGPWHDFALAARGYLRNVLQADADAASRQKGAGDLNRAVGLKSRQAEPLLFRAAALWHNQKWAQAEVDLKAALRLRPDHIDALRLSALLAAAKPGSFMARPAGQVMAETDATLPPPGAEYIGEKVGRYKILEQLGEGGMGTVFVAEQAEPVRRKVAIKIIKPGMDSREVIARFEAERQALALMEHPNIATILDAGTTDANRPYFVMELVRGLPITEYCDQAKFSLKQRIELLIPICHAVQHAHQKGIIHRDLKPSNILVTTQDAQATPKVIDFGVAKALHQPLTDRTVYTGFSQMIGTPLYMSPEQADLTTLDIDTRSDVYSLGALLYQLLTGKTPFDSDTLRRAGFDEMRRIIREDQPLRPSRRISTLEGRLLSTISQKRGLDERRFEQFLRGDLDWIVMKALEKDRTRRYESAGALAADIRRYLNDEPVLARAPSATYALRKYVRRNRGRLAAVGAIGVLGVSLATAVAWQALQRAIRHDQTLAAVTQTLNDADRAEQSAQWQQALTAVQQAEALIERQDGDEALKSLVRQRISDLSTVLRLEDLRIEMIAFDAAESEAQRGDQPFVDAFRDYGIDIETQSPEQIAGRLPNGPLRTEFVAALDAWAKFCRIIRNTERMNRLLAVSNASDPDPWRTSVRKALIARDFKALKALQTSPPLEDPFPPSETILLNWTILRKEVWDVLHEAQRRNPDDFWLNHALAIHYMDHKPPRWEEAASFHRAALALRPHNPAVLTNLGNLLYQMKRHDDAIAVHQQAIRIWPKFAKAYNNLGNALADKGELDEAVAAYRKAISLDPESVQSHYNLGTILFRKGEFGEAAKILREATRLSPSNAAAHTHLGHALKGLGNLAAAEDAYQTAVGLQSNNAFAHNGLGGIHYLRQEFPEAVKSFRRAVELAPDNSLFLCNLGNALVETADLEQAIARYREALRLSPQDASVLRSLGKALVQAGDSEEGFAALEKSIESQPESAEAYLELGNALTKKGAIDPAIAAYQRASRYTPDDFKPYANLCVAYMFKKNWDEAIATAKEAIRCKPDLPEAHCNLGHALREKGRLREALESLRRGHELGSKNPKWSYPSEQWVRECQRLIDQAGES